MQQSATPPQEQHQDSPLAGGQRQDEYVWRLETAQMVKNPVRLTRSTARWQRNKNRKIYYTQYHQYNMGYISLLLANIWENCVVQKTPTKKMVRLEHPKLGPQKQFFLKRL